MNPEPWRILLIEDLPIHIHLIQACLQRANVVLDSALSLGEGLQKLEQAAYDVILLDLGLPDSRGLATFQRLHQAFPFIPIIIFSSTDDEETALLAVQTGAQDYLIKNASLFVEGAGLPLIYRSIAYAIERHRIQSELLQERRLLEQRVEERTKELREANTRLQRLASSLVSAQEDERRRISLELHDEAGQFLTALQLSLNQIQRQLKESSPLLAAELQEAQQLTDTLINQLRNLAHQLRPPAIDVVGLNQALEDYCRKIARQSGIAISYSGSNASSLPGYVQLSLYRAVQEALTNVIKHAHASQVSVQLKVEADHTQLVIADNGCGFESPDPAASAKGIGLAGMKDRIEAVGGWLRITSRPGAGARLDIRIPRQDYPPCEF